MAAALPLVRRHRPARGHHRAGRLGRATGGTEAGSGSRVAAAIYGTGPRPDRPARDRLRRRPPPGRRHRRAPGAPGGRDVLADDLYDGQTIDAGRRSDDWLRPASRRSPSRAAAGSFTPVRRPGLRPQPRCSRTSARRSRGRTCSGRRGSGPRRRGRTLVDFGQNLVGWLRFTVRGPRGSEIRIRHAEVLEHDELGIRPLRDAQATDRFILSGGEDFFEPTMTFHGFRYAEITGWPGELTADDLEAVVVHSDLRRTGFFECSDAGCSTSCTATSCGAPRATSSTCRPTARSATSGSAGPATSPRSPRPRRTSSTSRPSSRDWLLDLALEQRHPDGMVPFVVPDVLKHLPAARRSSRSPTAPRSGATPPSGCRGRSTRRTATRRAGAAVRLDGGPRRRVETLLSPDRAVGHGFQFGDWLDPDASPHEPWNAKADNGRRRHRLPLPVRVDRRRDGRSSSAATDDAARLPRRWPTGPATAFNEHYVSDDGTIRSDCTTVYTLAIVFGLLDEETEPPAGERLAQLVAKSGYRISTGFAGTPFITDALTKTGHLDDAYGCCSQRECPSWLYPVTMGATTIWERWDSMLPDGTINPGEMTSFNHYALGAVADWMHRTIGGLSPAEPGYAAVRIAPRPGGGLTWAETALETAHGRIEVAWRIEAGTLTRADHPAPGRHRRALPGGRARRDADRGFAHPHRGDRMNLDDLLGKLDVRAKVRLLTGATFFTLHDDPPIELAAMAFSDGPTGVRGVEFSTGPAGQPAARTRRSWPRPGARRSPTRSALCWPRRPSGSNPRRPRPDDQPAPLPARRPALRGLLRGPAAHGPARRGVRARPAGARHRRVPQAPGRQRGRDRATHGEQRRRRARRCASSTCCRSRSPSRTPTRGR